jgi:hypothetical protein
MRTQGMTLHTLPLKQILKVKRFNRVLHYSKSSVSYFSTKSRSFSSPTSSKTSIYKTQTLGDISIDNNFNEWFVGFVDAEGNFLIGIDNRNKYTRFNFRFLIGLHVDDRPLLESIVSKLGFGKVINNKENTVSYFFITDTEVLKTKLFPILDKFPLNTTKHLDYLDFKEGLELSNQSSKTLNSNDRNILIDKILNLKNSMNNKRTNFSLPSGHIRITPNWLLGLIEGEGSFQLFRRDLVPAFSLSLTEVQRPVIESIVTFLEAKLDKYSLVKASHTKLFNLNLEKASDNARPKIKLSITQLEYLINIFIPFLETIEFKSKKKLDFDDFKFIATLIYQGKHLKPEIKDLILQISYSMNNFRLTTNKLNNLKPEEVTLSDTLDIIDQGFNFKPNLSNLSPISNHTTDMTPTYNPTLSPSPNINKLSVIGVDKEKLLKQPPIFVYNNEGEKFNIKTGNIIKDVYVIEVENTDNMFTIYPTLLDCAKALGVSRSIISNRIKTGNPLTGTNILKIRKIPVFRKTK